MVHLITLKLTFRAGDEAHQAARRTGAHHLSLLIPSQVMQPLDRRGEHRHASRLARPFNHRQMQDLSGWHLNQLMPEAVLDVARVPRAERIAERPAPPVHLHTHPPFAAIRRWAVVLVFLHQVGLEHLERQRHAAATECLRHHADEHLTAFSHCLDRQPADLDKAQPAGGVACARPAPPIPGGFDLTVQPFIQPPATTLHRHLRLQADAMADHVAGNRAQCLPRIGVITHQLAAAVAQAHQAAVDLSVSAGAAGHPVRGQPADYRAFIRTPAATGCWLGLLALSLAHAPNLTNRLRGSPRPAATFSAARSLATIAFSCASRSIS